MGLISHIGGYVPDKDDFTSYVERLNQFFFFVNDTKDTAKVPICQPPNRFDGLVSKLTKYFSPTTMVTAERFKFHKRNQ
ncbi:hypothetical protein PR048_006205 [Dryococelus australis]|uniref:Uncharacterized protein n=1 Tax=Dryococelus australis TaxID=614101 RepID=A0ABQ9IBJ3_9NEOP|nr:hypothetical protein PR048_006205 [Dryococelus australis]